MSGMLYMALLCMESSVPSFMSVVFIIKVGGRFISPRMNMEMSMTASLVFIVWTFGLC